MPPANSVADLMNLIVLTFRILVALGIASVVQAVGPYVTGALIAGAVFLALKKKPEAG